MAQFDAKFLAVDPFAYGNQVTASGTVVSGTLTYSGTVTISGSVWAGPILSIIPKGANVGDSGLKGLMITYVPTGETMTVSGMMSYASPLSVDYFNYLVTNSGVSSDYQGVYSRWNPGTNAYTITTTSGVRQGYNYVWSYAPRFYQ